MSADKVYNLIIADSQFLIVQALRSLIGADKRYTLAGVAASRHELDKFLENGRGNLLITDFANIDYDGIGDLKIIRENYPQLPLLILTNSITKGEFAALTKIGVRNIIYKTADKEEIFSAIESALKSKKFYSD